MLSLPRTPPPAPPSPTVLTQAQLARALPAIQLCAAPLQTALSQWSLLTGIPSRIRWETLERTGVSRNTEITPADSSASAENRLRRILLEAGIGTVPLAFDIQEDGGVAISTAEDIYQHPVLREYDVRDLLNSSPDLTGLTGSRLYQDRVAQITGVIEETVAADTWRNSGGYPRIITAEQRGIFFIHQTRVNHLMIEKLLQQIRRAVAPPPPAPPVNSRPVGP